VSAFNHNACGFYRSNDSRSSEYSAFADREGLGNAFIPLDGLRRNDTDVVLKFLASAIHYISPVDDPWFSAHREIIDYDAATGKNMTHYTADNPFTAMGCNVQVCQELSLMVSK
jgi:hypothetical protein